MLHVNYISIILGGVGGEKYMNKITGLWRNGRKNNFLAFRQGQIYLNREEIQIVIRLFSSNVLSQKKMK